MDKQEFLRMLASIDALRFGKFTLASGAESEFYLDLRYLPAFPKPFKEILELLEERVSQLQVDVIIGIPSAAISFASVLAYKMDIPSQLLRKQPKSHGRKRMIEGPSVKDKRVLLIDDLISSGFSKEFAIEALRAEGAMVTDLVVLVDRSEGKSQDWAESMNIKFHALFTLSADEILAFRP